MSGYLPIIDSFNTTNVNGVVTVNIILDANSYSKASKALGGGKEVQGGFDVEKGLTEPFENYLKGKNLSGVTHQFVIEGDKVIFTITGNVPSGIKLETLGADVAKIVDNHNKETYVKMIEKEMINGFKSDQTKGELDKNEQEDVIALAKKAGLFIGVDNGDGNVVALAKVVDGKIDSEKVVLKGVLPSGDTVNTSFTYDPAAKGGKGFVNINRGASRD